MKFTALAIIGAVSAIGLKAKCQNTRRRERLAKVHLDLPEHWDDPSTWDMPATPEELHQQLQMFDEEVTSFVHAFVEQSNEGDLRKAEECWDAYMNNFHWNDAIVNGLAKQEMGPQCDHMKDFLGYLNAAVNAVGTHMVASEWMTGDEVMASGHCLRLEFEARWDAHVYGGSDCFDFDHCVEQVMSH